jgi:hypothetical protein
MRNHFPEFCGEVANISNDLSHHVVEYIPGKRWFDLCVPDGPGVYRPVALDTSKACFVPASRWSSPHQPIRQSKQLRSWPASQSCRQGIVWVGRPPIKSRIPRRRFMPVRPRVGADDAAAGAHSARLPAN